MANKKIESLKENIEAKEKEIEDLLNQVSDLKSLHDDLDDDKLTVLNKSKFLFQFKKNF